MSSRRRCTACFPRRRCASATVGKRIGWRSRADRLEKIEKSRLQVYIRENHDAARRRNAHVQFEAKVQGVGEDGNACTSWRGSYYFDLDAIS